MTIYHFKIIPGIQSSKKVFFDLKIEAVNYKDAINQFCIKFFKIYEIQNKIKNNGGAAKIFSIHKTKTYSLSLFANEIEVFNEIKFNISKLGNNPIVVLQNFILNYIDNISNDVIEDFFVVNPFNNSQVLILNENDFSKREIKNLNNNGNIIETIFSDFEAFSICSGIEDNHSRFIAREYFKNNTTEYIVEAHIIAMSALEKYGARL